MVFKDIDNFIELLDLKNKGIIYENDIDIINYETDRNDRKRRDAEVLTTLAANINDNALDIGTGTGRSAYRLATNMKGIVHTINFLPDDYKNKKYFTSLLEQNEIGKYYKSKDIQNIQQHYFDTTSTKLPGDINNIELVFIDGGHDAATVYQDSQLAYSLVNNGYIIWHDFNYDLRYKYNWIDDVMFGVMSFLKDIGYNKTIYHLKDSFCGFIKI